MGGSQKLIKPNTLSEMVDGPKVDKVEVPQEIQPRDETAKSLFELKHAQSFLPGNYSGDAKNGFLGVADQKVNITNLPSSAMLPNKKGY